eukprot:944431-Prorocentrum_minimum.AAC.4
MPPAITLPTSRRQPIVTRGDSTRRRRAATRVRPPPGPWTEGYEDNLDPYNYNLSNDPANTMPQTVFPPEYRAGTYGFQQSALGMNATDAEAMAGGLVGGYGTVGAMYNGDRAELEFVLKLSGFFVLAAYAILAVIFFLIMHFSRNREHQYTRPRYDEDERDRHYLDHDGTVKSSAVQVSVLENMHTVRAHRTNLQLLSESIKGCGCSSEAIAPMRSDTASRPAHSRNRIRQSNL